MKTAYSDLVPQTKALSLERATILDILSDRAKHQANSLAYEYRDGQHLFGLTYRELADKVNAIATFLLSKNKRLLGSRAMLVYDSGLEIIAAFLGCLKAGVIAVPLYPPRRNQKSDRFKSIIDDCQPTFLLTTDDLYNGGLKSLSGYIAKGNTFYTNKIEISESINFPAIDDQSIAFLPVEPEVYCKSKGVKVTHQNIIANSKLIHSCFEHSAKTKVVSWLPFYHDMGLIGGILQPLYGGFPVQLFSPTAFLRKPLLWLESISSFGATTSGAPNFAYELCIKKISSEAKRNLDLSKWDLAFIGAEPVKAETINRFAEAFAECGFRKSSFYPCYGMAETTLMITGGLKQKSPTISQHDKRSVVSCGQINLGQEVIIVDPDSQGIVKDRTIGEIWVKQNKSIAAGYWQQKQLTQEKFQVKLSDTNQESNSINSYLKTGDLGFVENGELFITGRIKDLIIIRGQNYYPHDLERTVERSHPALQANSGAAFIVKVGGSEKLVIVQEVVRSFVRKLGLGKNNTLLDEGKQSKLRDEIEAAIRSAISQEFGLSIKDIRLLRTGSIAKTSSGKIQRYLCKERYLAELQQCGVAGENRSSSNEKAEEVEVQGGLAQLREEESDRVKSIIDWLRDYAKENVNSQLIDQRRTIPPYIVLDFGNQGLLGMQVPQEYGGLGLNNLETMQVLEQLGAIDTTLCLFVGLNNILGIRPILNYGSEELKNELLPILATGRELTAFALTEKVAGSNPQAIISRAIAQSDNSWSIHGEKIWSGSAAWAGVTNVFVQHQELDGKHRGISAFALRRGTPGLRQGKEALTMGMRGMVQNTVHFDGAIAAEKQLLGKVGKGMEVAQDAMMHGRLAISWSCLGGMKRCAQLMLRYTSRRQISTGRLLDNPLILNRLGGLTTKITAVECLVTQIAKLLDYQVKIPVELYTACKTSAPEFYWQAADDLVQFLGGRGYIETNIAPQILRDARVLRIFEGPTETLNMFLGSRVVSSDQDFADFLKNNFNAAEIHEKLLGAVKQINKRFADNPLFEKNLDNKRWIYILIGEIATYAILLAASKYSYSQQPTTEIKRAIAWAELQLQQKIDKALVVTPDELVTVTADLTSELINSYQEAIGDVQQNLAGEDWELDELLAVEQGSKELNSKRITETLVRRGEQRWKPASTKGARECPPREGEKRGEVSNTNKGELDKNKSVQDWLSQWLGKKLEIPQEKIDRSKSFADYGMDSVMAVELAEDLEQWLPNSLELEPTLAWNFPSIEALAGYLSEQGGQEVQESRGLNEAELQKTQEQGEQEKLNNLSEDELARSLMQEIALAKRRDN